ncbi:MAG: sugar transferase [Phycisphaeraceae bacterium]|nr:sugar transferase [Phycisphaerales bacterium]MCB9860990.1 sugar transferase [Phycisphaeraceae bacterium]
MNHQPRQATPTPSWTLWGVNCLDLHDRYWASRGIQVVRPGRGDTVQKGPKVFLLIGRTAVVDFKLQSVLSALHWQHLSAVRVRIVDDSTDLYHESVHTDDEGRVLKIARSYAGQLATTAQVWVTTHQPLAELWAQSEHRPHGTQVLGTVLKPNARGAIRVHGRVFDFHENIHVLEWLSTTGSKWHRVSSVFEGIYEYQPGVWVHESATIASDARLAGPLWIGANTEIKPVARVIGPLLLADETREPPTQPPVQWDLVFTPHWNKLPTLRGRSAYRVSKRLFDIAFALIMLLFTIPIYPLIMLAIYIEDGRPFFFTHIRQSRQGKPFPCLKFRTMYNNAEEMKAQLQAQNICDGPQFYAENDPRILKTGRFLRKTQLDEVPQLFNILLGQMSVVGPRPSPDKENQFCPAWRDARLSVRPGLTGLWQVRRTREPETDFQEWIRYDLEYVQQQSWRLDIWIIVQTFKTIF